MGAKVKDETPKTKFGGDYKTAQIYSMGYEFAFMSQKRKGAVYEQATPMVYCKDFLHDALWAFINQTNWQIHSFKYNYGKNPPLMLDHTALAFQNTQFKGNEDEFHGKMDACLEFLRLCERQLNLRPSEIHQVENKNGPCWLVLGDAGWQHSPTMISLYTLFIRLGCFHTPGAKLEDTLKLAKSGKIKIGQSGYAGNNDGSYVKQGWKGIELILKHGMGIWHPKQADNYPMSLRDAGLHDNYGIVNFTAKRPLETMPHWYRKEIWGKK